MATVQAKFKESSFVIALPQEIAKYLEVKKGDKVDYKINKKNGQVELIKIEGDKK